MLVSCSILPLVLYSLSLSTIPPVHYSAIADLGSTKTTPSLEFYSGKLYLPPYTHAQLPEVITKLIMEHDGALSRSKVS